MSAVPFAPVAARRAAAEAAAAAAAAPPPIPAYAPAPGPTPTFSFMPSSSSSTSARRIAAATAAATAAPPVMPSTSRTVARAETKAPVAEVGAGAGSETGGAGLGYWLKKAGLVGVFPSIEMYRLLALPPPVTSTINWPLEEEKEINTWPEKDRKVRLAEIERAKLAVKRYNANRELYGNQCPLLAPGTEISENPEAGYASCKPGWQGYFNDQDLICCEPPAVRPERVSIYPNVSERAKGQRFERIAQEKQAAREERFAKSRFFSAYDDEYDDEYDE